jgi:hypothetical protein
MTDQRSARIDLTTHDAPPAGAESSATPGAARAWTAGTKRHGLDERIEFASDPDTVLVRDPRYPDGPHLRFSPEQWAALLTAPTPATEIVDARDPQAVVDLRPPAHTPSS